MRWIDRLSELVGEGVSYLYLIAVIATFYEVIARYLFNAPTIWAHELTVSLVAAAFLLGGTYTLARRQHIRITGLYDFLPEPVRHWLDLLNLALTILFVGGLAYASWQPAVRALQRWETTGSAWDPPAPALLKPLLTVAALLMLAQAVAHLLRFRRGDQVGR